MKSESDGVRRTAVEDFVSEFLKYKISLNVLTSSLVPTFDKSEGVSNNFIRVTLLDSVQDETWRKGIIVGFYIRKGSPVLPIVAYRKGTIQVVPKVKMFPKEGQSIPFIRRDPEKQPIIFTIKINDFLNDEQDSANKFHYFHTLNILIDTIKKNQVGCTVRCAGTYKNPYIELITETVRINITEYKITNNFTKKCQKEYSLLYDNPDLKQLKSDIKELTSNSPINFRRENNGAITLQSRATKVMVGWLVDDNDGLLPALQKLESENGIPMDILVGKILKDYLDIAVLPYKEEAESLSTIIAQQLENDGYLEDKNNVNKEIR
ncbi:hypothetical protein F5ESL0230_05590 [Lactobacillus sp. ESL0230]|nr:hypothetical protein F5ESL0230_05590 [Lactobacillus sp. ESL0230]